MELLPLACRRVVFCWLLAGIFCVLTACVAGFSLSPEPGWPDSDGYAEGIESARWVAHPPGYPLFMAAGHAAKPFVGTGYGAVLAASFLLTLASSAAVVRLCSQIGGFRPAIWLGGTYALSWLAVLLCTTGTPHGGDMLFVALLLMVVWSKGFRASSGGALVSFFVLLLIIASFRLSTLIMLGPAVIVVILSKWRNIRVWFLAVALGISLLGLKELTLFLSGDAAAFQLFAANLHTGAKMTSPLLSGIRVETLMNIFRTLLWTGMALALISILCMAALSKIPKLWKTAHLPDSDLWPLLFTLCAALGPVAVCGLYHIPHPGYLAPAIPAFFALAAYACKEPLSKSGRLLPWCASLSAAFWLTLWFYPSFDPTPSTKAGAVWNAFVGQYTRDARLASTWKSLSSWLVFSGQGDSVSDRRKENLKLDRRFQ